MALTQEELNELRAEILRLQPELSAENLNNLSQDELVELGSELASATSDQEPIKYTDYENYPFATTFTQSFLDTATLGNLAEAKALEGAMRGLGDYTTLRDQYEAELSQMQDAESIAKWMGKGTGFVAGMAALPATLPLKGLSFLQRAAATGALTGALSDTGSNEGEMWYESPEGVIDKLAASGAGALGGFIGAKYLPPAMEKLGKAIYTRPFRKLDAVLREQGKEPISEILWKYKVTGDMEGVRNGLKNVLNENQFKVVEAAWDAVEASGQKFDPDELYNILSAPLKTQTVGKKVGAIQDVGAKESFNAVDDYLKETVKAFRPAGYQEAAGKYAKDYRTYLGQKKAFEQAGGVGAQPPLPYAMGPQRTEATEVVTELIGKPPSELVAEGPNWAGRNLRIDKKNLITGFDIRPQAEKIVKPIKEPFFVPEQPNIFNAIQKSIFGTDLVPRTTQTAEIPGVGVPRGQMSIPLEDVPVAPTRPSKDMNVYELSKFMKRLGQEAEKGFAPKGTKERVPVDEEILAPLYGVLKNIREEAVEKASGPEARKAFSEANKEISSALSIFPKMSKEIVKESGKAVITPIEFAFLTNPYTASMAVAKEAAEGFGQPKVATNLGQFMKRLAEGTKAGKSGALINVPARTAIPLSETIPYYLQPEMGE